MESVLYDGLVGVHYGFIQMFSEREEWPEPDVPFAGQTNGLLGGAHPGFLSMTVGLHTGDVPVRVVLRDHEPSLGDWEEVVEVSFGRPQLTSGSRGSTTESRSSCPLPPTAHAGAPRIWMPATPTASRTPTAPRRIAMNSRCGRTREYARMRSSGRQAIKPDTGMTRGARCKRPA